MNQTEYEPSRGAGAVAMQDASPEQVGPLRQIEQMNMHTSGILTETLDLLRNLDSRLNGAKPTNESSVKGEDKPPGEIDELRMSAVRNTHLAETLISELHELARSL